MSETMDALREERWNVAPGRPSVLDRPLRWRKRRRVWVCPELDLFHEDVPDEFIDQVFGVMAISQYVGRCRRRDCDHEGFACEGHIDPPTRHQFQVLTKRPERARQYLSEPNRRDRVAKGARQNWYFDMAIMEGMDWPLPNVWLGVSCEDQPTADERIPILLDTPAAVRFVSCEPLLGPIDLTFIADGDEPFSAFRPRGLREPCDTLGIDWAIVGGESGPKARPCEVDWIRSIVKQCKAAGVPAFVKQDSGPRPGQQGRIPDDIWLVKEWPHGP